MFEKIVNEEPVREIEPLIFCITILIFNRTDLKARQLKKIGKHFTRSVAVDDKKNGIIINGFIRNQITNSVIKSSKPAERLPFIILSHKPWLSSRYLLVIQHGLKLNTFFFVLLLRRAKQWLSQRDHELMIIIIRNIKFKTMKECDLFTPKWPRCLEGTWTATT